MPGTSSTIDTFEQLLDADGWTWGYEPSYGAGWEWFKTNTNPVIKRIYEGMEVSDYVFLMITTVNLFKLDPQWDSIPNRLWSQGDWLLLFDEEARISNPPFSDVSAFDSKLEGINLTEDLVFSCS